VTTVLGHLREARSFDRASSHERRRRVQRRLATVVARALAGAAHYRGARGEPLKRALAARDADEFFAAFAGLEPLSKATLASSFDALSTDPEITLARVIDADAGAPGGDAILRTKRGTYNIKKTSGTSGRIVYQVDTLATQRVVTSIVLYRALLRTLLHDRSFGALLPFPRRARLVLFVHRGNRSVYQGATKRGAPRWARALMDVDIVGHDATLADILARLDRYAPDFVYGLPSRIEWLAQAQIAKKLHIAPRAIFVGGETLHERLARECAEAWPRARLVNTYGTTETKPIATACPECRELHVCEDLVHLELLRADGRPCADGEEAGRVLATSLWNLTVPILRYELDDRIVPLDDAGCRWRTKRIRVRGREPMFLWTQDRRDGAWRPLEGRSLSEALTALDGIVGYRVVHDRPGRLALTVVVTNGAAEARRAAMHAARACVERFVAEHGCAVSDVLDDVDVDVVDFETFNREGGKLRSIQSSVAPPELAPA
jgi:phenylacetate-coenzyme A ligase PaaK-like adenylate-forming protein